ncbi:exopolysaccharide biosynthesis polyprenyl glycosylphosphotransferase [Flavimarina sp. Hel_I_48]|uniref:exopolysaccharide biosynthesis polyprenyl glycosylphosphotransferase n=1 Tax=Flavimarina sp. Hel_I_48 TaxID=1392488 RepID=UPI0004DF2738|nr:exopolysaccharide biosynthesis polyprenyl glycosylphosphotransferase [Flavimarina sp. Hel_I_48]
MPLSKSIHFDIPERKVFLRIFDLLSVFLVLILLGHIFNYAYFSLNGSQWSWLLTLGLYLMLFGTIFELYDLQRAASFQTTLKNILLTVSVTLLFYMLTPFFTPVLPANRIQIVVFFSAMVVALVLWRYMYITLFSAPRFNKRVLVVGNAFDIKLIVKNLHVADPNYKVIGYINTDNSLLSDEKEKLKIVDVTELDKAVRRYSVSEIVVSSAGKGVNFELYGQLIRLLEKGFSIREYTQVYEEITQKVPVEHMEQDFYKYFPFSRSNKNSLYLFFNRIFNMVFAILGSVLTLLLIPFILMANFIANAGPLFYQQERVGLNGKNFSIIKFRTMIRNAEAHGAQWSQKGDRRITRFGKIMRNTRLDELPQCLNILRGEMSLIGPRPERPEFVEKLSLKIPFYETRHVIKPGLTGWAQVRGRYAKSEQDSLEKLQYDLYYIKHRNLFLDLSILLKTCSTMIYFRGQ